MYIRVISLHSETSMCREREREREEGKDSEEEGRGVWCVTALVLLDLVPLGATSEPSEVQMFAALAGLGELSRTHLSVVLR